MKKLFSVFFIILFSLAASATNHYIKSSGGTGAGTNDATAWSYAYFLTKSQKLPAGDSVFFRRGDFFPITAIVRSRSGVYYGAYGTGAKPVFSGLKTLSGWTNAGSGVYYTSLEYDVNFLMINGVQTAKGRYPKATYSFRTYTGSRNNAWGNSSFVDASLSSSTSWVGATVVARASGQKWHKMRVDSQAVSGGGSKLTLQGQEPWWSDGYGYFFQNHPNILTAAYGAVPGDWRYDAATGRIYVYLGAGTPSDYVIKAPARFTIFDASARANVSVENLCIEGGTNGIFLGPASTAVTVKNCELRYCYNGLSSDRCTSHRIVNNDVHDCTDMGLTGSITCTNFTVEYNFLHRLGMVLGAGESGPSSMSALYWEGGTGFVVRRNRIDTVGFIGMRALRGKDILFEENIVKNVGYLKDDNGGFYAWSAVKDNAYANFTNRIVRRNIFVNGREEGKLGGNNSARQSGLYIDSRVNHVVFDSNIIYNMYGYGFVDVGGCQDITLTNNIFARCSRNNLEINIPGGGAETYINNNVIHSYGSVKGLVLNSKAGLYNTVATHNNTYISSSTSIFDFDAVKTLAQVQSAYSMETGSTWSAAAATDTLIWNENFTTDSTFNFTGKRYRDAKTNITYDNSVTLKPMTGMLLRFVTDISDAIAPVPGTLMITAYTQTTISASATAATDNVGGTLNYKWYYSPNVYATVSAVESGATLVSGSALTQTFSSLPNGTLERIYLIVQDPAGNKALYPVASQTTLPALPAAPPAPVLNSTDGISATFTLAGITGANSLNVYRSTTLGGTYNLVVAGLTPGIQTIRQPAASTYYYKTAGVNESGTGPLSVASDAATTSSGTLLPAKPGTPGASNITQTSAAISTSLVSGATGYKFYLSTSEFGDYTYSGNSSSMPYTISGLTPGTQYWIKVSAVIDADEGSQSAAGSFVTAPLYYKTKGRKPRL